MQQFKIEEYETQFDKKFPEFESLSKMEGDKVIRHLRNNIPGASERGNIFATIEDNLEYDDYDEEVIYDIAYLFSLYDFADAEKMYIIWNEDTVDAMNKFPFINAWTAIWKPEFDERIILYTPATGKVLLITQYGAVYSN
ncbi:MAG: hypothetical protein R2800_03900 [Flavipsychrobacter sp.]